MSATNKELSEQESLRLITEMIQKVKSSAYETGVSPLLWGTVVFIAAFVSFLQAHFKFSLPFNIWLITAFAIVPQVIISINEGRQRKVRSYDDHAVDLVWTTFAITLFGLIIYGNIIPYATDNLSRQDGWVLAKQFINSNTPPEPIKPFAPSFTSIFILIYAFPTLVTGLAKNFKPMLYGAVVAYGLFIASCFTASKYDMLLAAISALVCWFFPGLILRKKYLKQKKVNV